MGGVASLAVIALSACTTSSRIASDEPQPTPTESPSSKLCPGGKFPPASSFNIRSDLELDSVGTDQVPTGTLTLQNSGDSPVWVDWIKNGKLAVASALDDSGAIETIGPFTTAVQTFALAPGRSIKLSAIASTGLCGTHGARLSPGRHSFAVLLQAGPSEGTMQHALSGTAEANVSAP